MANALYLIAFVILLDAKDDVNVSNYYRDYSYNQEADIHPEEVFTGEHVKA